MYSLNIARCQHIKVNGTQCGSPALRRNRLCYFHKRWREQHIVLNSRGRLSKASFDLPVLEDANSIQVALMQVLRLLLTGQIEQKTASLVLYGLQTASSNLRHTGFESVFKESHVIDPRTVDETPLGQYVWENEDFEDEEEEEEESGRARARNQNRHPSRRRRHSSLSAWPGMHRHDKGCPILARGFRARVGTTDERSESALLSHQ